MSTTLQVTQVKTEADPDAPETLLHISVTGNIVGTGTVQGFDYDYNTAIAEVPTFCEAAASADVEFETACED